jgi:hypothetical protein
MMKWLTSLVLVVTLGGGALAGIPLHSNDTECTMSGMMDCCKAALSRSNTPQVASARLCCSLNCSQNGTTPANGVRVQPKMQPTLSAHLTGAQTILPSMPVLRHGSHSHGPPIDSPPAYICHLALLI